DLLDVLHARQVVVLTAYLDESEQEGARLFAVGGYLFDRAGQRRFEWKWKRALASRNLSRFRMSEFENRKGEFADWAEKDRVPFFRRLVDIIRSTALVQISVALDQ